MRIPETYDIDKVAVGNVRLFFSGLSFWKGRVLFCFDSLDELKDLHSAIGLMIQKLERVKNDMGRERA